MSEVRIFRADIDEAFAVLHNEFLQASGDLLSAEAIGIGAHLMSRPPTWNISVRMLQRHHGMGRERVQKALNELACAGYAGRIAVRDERGRLNGQHWILASRPNNFGKLPPNHLLIPPTVRSKTRQSVSPAGGNTDGQPADRNKTNRNHTRLSGKKTERPFPADGTIMWSPWGEIARDELRHHGGAMPDIDLVAANFRRWCASANIELDAARIEKTFRGFCRKVRPA